MYAQDIATRRFLSKCVKHMPDKPYYYFGDFDPHGFLIYLTYQDGPRSKETNVESRLYDCPSLLFCGLLAEDTIGLKGCQQVNDPKYSNLCRRVYCRIVARLREDGVLTDEEESDLIARLAGALTSSEVCNPKKGILRHMSRLAQVNCEFEAAFRDEQTDLAEWFWARVLCVSRVPSAASLCELLPLVYDIA
eukprot:Blabericola_migrator_1__12962@NODE_859_length_6239_cov_134_489469_g609_i0_p5_GENE_NODE_859_length_6239_cov_134_489469_g609_i0NODE_859_length_6239_cov_134_489469_g609_i0_p5_ORF_typecomplete_len192_score40_12DUF2220/PF09983_9/1_8e05DUF2399/PF09664_10/0_0042_NODE_859_length_6239_cov_134_489469_g609_i064639